VKVRLIERVHIGVLIALVSVQSVCATTIVVKRDGDRLLMAVDNRVGRNISGEKSITWDDHVCKIVSSAHTIAAVFSNAESYREGLQGKFVQDWNALEDIQATIAAIGDDTEKVSTTWVRREAQHFANLQAVDPKSVSTMVLNNPNFVLVGGVFVGWRENLPVLNLAWVTVRSDHLLVNETPISPEFSTNPLTDELIKGQTTRAQSVANGWNILAKKYPAGSRSWRHMQYLVEQTSLLDPSVSRTSDVVEISQSAKPVWLHHSSCK
jgi:hypothetical protein